MIAGGSHAGEQPSNVEQRTRGLMEHWTAAGNYRDSTFYRRLVNYLYRTEYCGIRHRAALHRLSSRAPDIAEHQTHPG